MDFKVYVFIGIAVVFLLLLVFGSMSEEVEPSISEDNQSSETEDLKNFKQEQKARFEQISATSPSVVRSSVVMWVIQLTSLAAIFLFIAVLLYDEYHDNIAIEDKSDTYIGVAVMIAILLTIRGLAKMVRRRNAYIMDLEEVIHDSDKK